MIVLISDIQTFYVSSDTYKESHNLPLEVVEKGLTEVYDRVSELNSSSDPVYIIHGGDLFERNVPFAQTINKFVYLFKSLGEQYPNIHFLTTTGNHDQRKGYPFRWDSSKDVQDYPVTYLHSIQDACDNFQIIDARTPEGINLDGVNFHTPPYFRYESEFKNYLSDVIKTHKDTDTYQVLVMHQDIDPIIPESSIYYGDEMFEFFEHVYFGHIHNRPTLGKNFTALGSLFQMKGGDSLGENAYKKGFWVLRPENDCKASFHQVDSSPVFRYLDQGDPIPKDWEGDYIQRNKVSLSSELTEVSDLSDLSTDKGKQSLLSTYSETQGLPEEVEKYLSILINKLDKGSEGPIKDIEVKSITIEGIQSIVNPITVPFNKAPITFYLGKKGSGKSTALLYALYWVWTGKYFNGRGTKESFTTKKSLRKAHDKKWRGSRVLLNVSVDGAEFILARHIKFTDNTYSYSGDSSFMIFKVDPETDTPVLHDLAKDLGWDGNATSDSRLSTELWEKFTHVGPDLLKSLVMFDIYSTNLVFAKDSERTSLFKSMLKLDWVDDLFDTMGKDLELKQAEIRALEAKQALLSSVEELKESEINKLNNREDGLLEDIKELSERTDATIGSLSRELEDNQMQLSSLLNSKPSQIPEDKEETLNNLRSEISELTEQISETRFQIRTAESNIESYDKAQTNYDSLKMSLSKSVETFKELEESIIPPEVIKIYSDKIDELSSSLDRMDEVIDYLNLQERNIDEVIKSLLEELNELDDYSDSLESHECPTCGSGLSEDKVLDLIAEASKKRKEIEGKLSSARSDIASVAVDIEEMSLIIEEYDDFRHYLIDRKTEAVIANNTLKSGIDREVQAQKLLGDELDKLDNSTFDVREAEALIKSLESSLRTLTNKKQSLQDRLSSEEQDIRSVREAWEKWSEDESDLLADVRSLTERIESHRGFYDRTQKKNESELSQIRKELSEVLSQISKTKKDLNTCSKNLEELSKSYEVLKQAYTKSKGSSGLAAFATKSKLDIINKLSSRYGKCVNQEVSLNMRMRDSGSVTYDLSLKAEGIEVENLSGGQTGLANLIFMFALSDYYSQTSAKFNMMVLDEPIKPVSDEEEIGLIYDLLETRSQETNLHLIAHPTDTYFETGNTVVFEKPNKGSTTITK